jgi:sigma-E factor negative regulatory protein RseA
MSEQIREQVSAFLDGELPNSETELLLKRLTRDAELRESFGRYALIGESLRGGGSVRLSQNFHTRVNRAIDGEPLPAANNRSSGAELQRWWRPAAGAAVAAGVMAVAVLSFQQRADVPSVVASLPPVTVRSVSDASLTDVKPHEALSYTTPAAVGDAPAAMPAARFTSYVFAHSKYSSMLGESNVLSGLLTDADDQEAAGADQVSLPKDVHDGSP